MTRAPCFVGKTSAANRPRKLPSSSGGANLGDQLFALIAEYLEDNGLTVNTGTIVDASIIDAPSSQEQRSHCIR